MIRRLWHWWCGEAMTWRLWASFGLTAVHQFWAPARRVLPPPTYFLQLLGN